MDNKTINKDYTCKECLYEDENGTHERCMKCARNNLSGYYKDEYVNVYDVDAFVEGSCKRSYLIGVL